MDPDKERSAEVERRRPAEIGSVQATPAPENCP